MKDIIKGNKLIAEFMGGKIPADRDTWIEDVSGLPFPDSRSDTKLGNFHLEQGKYHKSWDWLMPVVEKIWKMKKMVCINYYTDSNAVECKIYNWGMGEPQNEAEHSEPIQAVWLAVVEFIKWHSKTKNP